MERHRETASRTISQRELRNSSGEVLRAVAAGETILITNNAKPAALLTPVPESVRDRLLAAGRLARFDRVPGTNASLRQAGLLPHLTGSYLRSLDALHIVAALDTSQSAFVTYDRTAGRRGNRQGMRVVAPGRPRGWYRGAVSPPG